MSVADKSRLFRAHDVASELCCQRNYAVDVLDHFACREPCRRSRYGNHLVAYRELARRQKELLADFMHLGNGITGRVGDDRIYRGPQIRVLLLRPRRFLPVDVELNAAVRQSAFEQVAVGAWMVEFEDATWGHRAEEDHTRLNFAY